MQSLLRTRPQNLDDLTIQVAIIRPGPIQGGAVNPYIERRRRLREDPAYEIPYEHPALEPVLRDTLGTIIFQDQVMEVAEAFAGFTPGEADGLRRAMSRKRSREVLQRHRERFVRGRRCAHAGAERETAERVWQMVEGFAGFGFPKAHSAAFGLLAYQSTWLRVHYGAGVPVRAAQRAADGLLRPRQPRARGRAARDRDAAPRRQRLGGGVHRAGRRRAPRPRLHQGRDRARRCAELVAEREQNGPFASLGELAGRIGARRRTLEQLAWSGACDEITTASATARRAGRRSALWQLGIAAPGLGAGDEARSSRCRWSCRAAPRLRSLGRWQRLIADYATSGVTVGDHAMAILRERLAVPMLATSAQLARLPSGGAVAMAGLVIARQRPGTAKGTMFLLFEDEWGTVNLIVPKAVYERHRHLARAEPLLLARGSRGALRRRRQPDRARARGAGALCLGWRRGQRARGGQCPRAPPAAPGHGCDRRTARCRRPRSARACAQWRRRYRALQWAAGARRALAGASRCPQVARLRRTPRSLRPCEAWPAHV